MGLMPSSCGKNGIYGTVPRRWTCSQAGSCSLALCTSEALTEHPELPVGTGAWQLTSSHVTPPEVWETRTALWHGFGSCSHIFRKWVKIKFNINSPASCTTSRGRTAKPGGTKEKGPASNPRATWGLQLPGQTRHHSRVSAAKYFYSNRFYMYRSTEK